MPPLLMQNFDNKALQSFIVWKNNAFARYPYYIFCTNLGYLDSNHASRNSYCRTNGHPVDKSPVECRNLQVDKKTFCFGPDMFFTETDNGVEKTEVEKAPYVWVTSHMYSLVPLELNTGGDDSDLAEVMRRTFFRHEVEDAFFLFVVKYFEISVFTFITH